MHKISESIDPAPQEKWPILSWEGGAGENFRLENTCIFFVPGTPKKYMKNICCYYFLSQHDAFWFFLTFLTLKNNLKRLNTKRQKKRLIFNAFVLNFSWGGRRRFDHFSWGAGSHGFSEVCTFLLTDKRTNGPSRSFWLVPNKTRPSAGKMTYFLQIERRNSKGRSGYTFWLILQKTFAAFSQRKLKVAEIKIYDQPIN